MFAPIRLAIAATRNGFHPARYHITGAKTNVDNCHLKLYRMTCRRVIFSILIHP